MDEVQTGFGRTGENFAHQLFGVKPDLMGCGKAAGGGILPVSFVAGRDDSTNRNYYLEVYLIHQLDNTLFDYYHF